MFKFVKRPSNNKALVDDGLIGPFSLVRLSDGLSASGHTSLCFYPGELDDESGEMSVEYRTVPRVGALVRIGVNFLQTTEIKEIVSENVFDDRLVIRFNTTESMYEWVAYY